VKFFSKFFFPASRVQVQEKSLKLYRPKDGETVLSYMRKGGTYLWLPVDVNRKGESRNAYLERFYYSKLVYSRRDMSLYLSTQRRIFIGNNSYASFYSPCVGFVFKLGENWYATRPAHGRKATWFRRRPGDRSASVRLKTAFAYCLYLVESL